MKNPQDFQLNFTNLFRRREKTPIEPSATKRSFSNTSMEPRQSLMHKTQNFLPTCPYGRILIGTFPKRNIQPSNVRQISFDMFSANILERSTSPRFLTNRSAQKSNQSVELKSSKSQAVRSRTFLSSDSKVKSRKSASLCTNDKFEVLKMPLGTIGQERMKIRGLKIRTGSEAKKLRKNRARIDYEVAVMGRKMI